MTDKNILQPVKNITLLPLPKPINPPVSTNLNYNNISQYFNNMYSSFLNFKPLSPTDRSQYSTSTSYSTNALCRSDPSSKLATHHRISYYNHPNTKISSLFSSPSNRYRQHRKNTNPPTTAASHPFTIYNLCCATLLLLLLSNLYHSTSASCAHKCSPGFQNSNEHRLLRRSFDIYGDGCEECKLARPIEMEPETMLVEFGVALIQVIELDEKRQTMNTHIWEYHVWHDHRLSWNISEFGNLKSVNPPKNKIWNPSITLYNVIEKVIPYDHPLNVWHTGEVLWVTQAIYKSPCDVKTYNFPFDEHQCNFTFGSWTHSESQLNLTFYANQDKILMMSYYNNPQWHIQNITMERFLHYYQCCPDPFVQLIYSFTLRRRVAFFAFVLILPSVLLSMLTLVIFCLPADSTDKINIGLSIFLSYFVLLMILVEQTPTSGQAIPLLGQYFCVSLVIIAMSVVSSTIIINIHSKKNSKDRSFNKKIRKYLEYLARVLCVYGPWSKKRKTKKLQQQTLKMSKEKWFTDNSTNDRLLNHHSSSQTAKSMEADLKSSSKSPTISIKQFKSTTSTPLTSIKTNNGGFPTSCDPTADHSDGEDLLCNDTGGLNRERGSFKMALRRGLGEYTTTHGGWKDRTVNVHEFSHSYSAAAYDWVLLASILDRLFFFIYFLINLTAATVIFTRAIP